MGAGLKWISFTKRQPSYDCKQSAQKVNFLPVAVSKKRLVKWSCSAASDLDLHCLFRSVRLNIYALTIVPLNCTSLYEY